MLLVELTQMLLPGYWVSKILKRKIGFVFRYYTSDYDGWSVFVAVQCVVDSDLVIESLLDKFSIEFVQELVLIVHVCR